MNKELDRVIILEIPVIESLPQMWHKYEGKPMFLKWLDDKPCIYGCVQIGDNYIFTMNSPEYITREWIEKYLIPMNKLELTIDEAIGMFENKGLSKTAQENLNKKLGIK